MTNEKLSAIISTAVAVLILLASFFSMVGYYDGWRDDHERLG